jgi:hypothetical protein
MKKNLKALLLGYVLFDVNGEKFFVYENARKKRITLCGGTGNVQFKGWSLFLIFSKLGAWRSFYSKGAYSE